MQLKNKNISLRKIQYEDTPLIIKWRNTESVKINLFTQTELTEEQHLWWMKNKIETGQCCQFIIETIIPLNPIGTVFIKNIDHFNKKGEFGIFIGEKSSRGSGFGTTATLLILNFAFAELGLNRVYLSVLKDNVIGIKCYKNAGFKIEGILRKDFKRNDCFIDVVTMAILKEEWKGMD